MPDSSGLVLVEAAEVEQLLAAGSPVLLDVRWVLGDPRGHEHYLDGHIPGARFVDLERDLSRPGPPTDGRHPLPEIVDLQTTAQGWGISGRDPVVVYDDNAGLAAARAWWLLRWAGVADVRILDGALAGWVAGGRPLERGEPEPVPPGDVVLSAGHLPVLDVDGAVALARRGRLLDARAGERYRGEVEPIDPKAGHIPGALSLPTTQNVDAAGRFVAAADVRASVAALGVELGGEDGSAVGVYCGSGVTAAHEIAALATAGIVAALYPGSWSAWSNDPDRPVATGPGSG